MNKQLKIAIGLILSGLALTMHAQSLQWASRIVDVSSEFHTAGGHDSTNYTAANALGPPEVYPHAGPLSKSWLPGTIGSAEYLRVQFDNAISLRQIGLFETNHPGALEKIVAYDTAGNAHVLLTFEPAAIDLPGRLLIVAIDKNELVSNDIAFYFDGSVANGRIGVDAVVITDDPNASLDKLLPDYYTKRIVVSSLGPAVNGPYLELNPIKTPDGNTLYFSRGNDPQNLGNGDAEDIWMSERDAASGRWTEAKRVNGAVNSRGPNFISSIHERHDTLSFLLGNAYHKKRVVEGLSQAFLVNGTWTIPHNIHVENFYNTSPRGSFYSSTDDGVIVMSIKRRDSRGGNDLYISRRIERDVYGQPENLGSVLNGIGDEITPFLSRDNRTLYFASNGHGSTGGFDLYKSFRTDDTWIHWAPPENLGTLINSKADEFNLSIASDGTLFFVRGSIHNTDIFRADSTQGTDRLNVVFVRGLVVDQYGTPVSTDISVLDADKNMLDKLRSDETGAFALSLEKDKPFLLALDSSRYDSSPTAVNSRRDTVAVVLKATPKTMERHVVIDTLIAATIYFEFGQRGLHTKYESILDNLALRVLAVSGESVIVSGHTDAIGDSLSNMRLSEQRADIVRKALVNRGVAANRIRAHGMGEQQPKSPNTHPDGSDNPAGRRRNRRAEIVIIRASQDVAPR